MSRALGARLAPGHCVVYLGKTLILLSQCLSGVYDNGPGQLWRKGGGSRARTGMPSHPRRVVKCLIVLCSGNRDELWPDGIRDLRNFFLFFYFWHFLITVQNINIGLSDPQ